MSQGVSGLHEKVEICSRKVEATVLLKGVGNLF